MLRDAIYATMSSGFWFLSLLNRLNSIIKKNLIPKAHLQGNFYYTCLDTRHLHNIGSKDWKVISTHAGGKGHQYMKNSLTQSTVIPVRGHWFVCIAISPSHFFFSPQLSVPHTSHPQDEIHLRFLFNLFYFSFEQKADPLHSFKKLSVCLHEASGSNTGKKKCWERRREIYSLRWSLSCFSSS